MKRNIFLVSLFFTGILLSQFSSCKKDNFLTEGGRIGFSTDTLYFDTVFTTLGSVTHEFKIFNRNDRPIKISNIRIEQGEQSFFRLNVDGIATKNISDIELAANDSIYVFAALTVDPNNEVNPFVINDRVLVDFNGTTSEVALQAYGQNAHFIFGDTILPTQTWINDLPYVIVNDGDPNNSFRVAEGETLTIQKGCRIYMRQTSRLFVSGTLQCFGTKEDSIIFQGDRLDRSYFGQDFPGEWGGIYFLETSTGSNLNHVIIKNGGAADASVFLEPPATPIPSTGYMLEMNKCVVANSLGFGVVAFNSVLNMNNCLVHSCGQQNFAALQGGRYNLNFCTFATYGGDGISHINQPVMALLNYFDISQTQYLEGDLDINLKNCIIYGSLETELLLANKGSGQYQANFENCLIRMPGQLPGSVGNTNIIYNQDPQFEDRRAWDYSLSSSSPAKGIGQAIGTIVDDIVDAPRSATPTIGCFE